MPFEGCAGSVDSGKKEECLMKKRIVVLLPEGSRLEKLELVEEISKNLVNG